VGAARRVIHEVENAAWASEFDVASDSTRSCHRQLGSLGIVNRKWRPQRVTVAERRYRSRLGLQLRVPHSICASVARPADPRSARPALRKPLRVEEAEYIDYPMTIARPKLASTLVKAVPVFSGDGESPFAPLPCSSIRCSEWGFTGGGNDCPSVSDASCRCGGAVMASPSCCGGTWIGQEHVGGSPDVSSGAIAIGRFGLVRPGGTEVTPFPRPIPLKNESIELIHKFIRRSPSTHIPRNAQG